MIVRCSTLEQPGWLQMRCALWPDCSPADHMKEMATLLSQPGRFLQLVACDGSERPVGFAEASLRSDFVNGTSTSPVAYLEGIYVVPEARRRGVAKSLVSSIAEWAVVAGCQEMASDAALENVASQAAHKAMGFEETERVVCFCRSLA